MGEPYGIEALALDVAEAIARYPNERERIEAVKPSLARWMERQQGLLPDHRLPCEGNRACGHLLHTAEDGSFFIISVVFPPGTRSGVHYHGASGVIGVLEGEDEATKYARPGGPTDVNTGQECGLQKTRVDHVPPGGITHIVPPELGCPPGRSAA